MTLAASYAASWLTTTSPSKAINPHSSNYLDFPEVAQVSLIERQVIEKKTGKTSCELAYGITSRPATQASPERLLEINRGHWGRRVAETLRRLNRNVRTVFDYLLMSENSRRRPAAAPA